jgi:hypothetical protein
VTADDLEILGWDERHAVALVKGVKVRINRTTRWICAEHGTELYPHCEHLRALAQEPANPQKRN